MIPPVRPTVTQFPTKIHSCILYQVCDARVGALAVCDENRTEVFALVNIKQNSLALLTRDGCRHHLGFQNINAHVNCCGMVVKSFKQALHLPVAVTQEHNIAGVSEVRYVDVRPNLTPWIALQGLTKNPVDNVVVW